LTELRASLRRFDIDLWDLYEKHNIIKRTPAIDRQTFELAMRTMKDQMKQEIDHNRYNMDDSLRNSMADLK